MEWSWSCSNQKPVPFTFHSSASWTTIQFSSTGFWAQRNTCSITMNNTHSKLYSDHFHLRRFFCRMCLRQPYVPSIFNDYLWTVDYAKRYNCHEITSSKQQLLRHCANKLLLLKCLLFENSKSDMCPKLILLGGQWLHTIRSFDYCYMWSAPIRFAICTLYGDENWIIPI